MKSASQNVDLPHAPGAALTVADIMSHQVVTLSEFEDMDLAGLIMSQGRIRHLPVVDDAGRLVGLVTHRDLLRVSVSDLADLARDERRGLLRGVPVREVMRRDVATTTRDAPLAEAANRLVDHKYGCLPVVDVNEQLVGIVTEADFVRLTARLLGAVPAADAS